ncbi:T9SS type A sorting domain-containing protein [Lewinella sp. JB7]|uniref:T9SS type A sorting domain-containing protein n=1 Tax=Lewinella sp. JB7 TaxID=2962887 RepID=UPI0020CA0093|nr:T9SS type A sorting domain-containing protein [Lewinella sp. JB7]MCP9235447.1 T9SS type A sorting domain-containing protein [Lewinella sp. JB7]
MTTITPACGILLLVLGCTGLYGQAPSACSTPPSGGNHPNGNAFFSSVTTSLEVGDVVSGCISLTGSNAKILTLTPQAASGEGDLLKVVTSTATASETLIVTASGGPKTKIFTNDIIHVEITALSTGRIDFNFPNPSASGSTRTFVISGSVAPVTWSRPLTYTVDREQLQLSWSVTDQMDVAGYELEVDNGTSGGFRYAESIPYRENGSREVTYSVTVSHEVDGHHYRIKQLDHAGTFDYSNVIYVPGAANHDQLVIFPNPTSRFVRIVAPDRVQSVDIFTADGRLVRSYPAASLRQGIDLFDLARGTYILRPQPREIFADHRLIIAR